MISNFRELADVQLEDLLLAGVRGLRAASPALCAETLPRYAAAPAQRLATVNNLLQCATELLRRQELLTLRRGPALLSAMATKDYLRYHFAVYEHEAFVVVFLDAQCQVLAVEEMFRGTLTHAAVYPREIARRVLELACHSVILAHNHPSGSPEPSKADERVTAEIKGALSVLEVRVLDHLIVAGSQITSLAERGLV